KQEGDGELILLDSMTCEKVRHLSNVPVVTLAFSPDGQFLAAADRTATLWNVADGQLVHTFSGHAGIVYGIAFRPDGAQVATAGADRTVRLWDVRSGREERIYRGHATPLRCLAYHPTAPYLASGDIRGEVKVWDLTRDPGQTTIDAHVSARRYTEAMAFL